MMETVSPYSGRLLSREISRLVKRLRFYIGNFIDKCGGTLNMLKVLEEKIETVHLDDMEVRGRCKPKMELPYSEWIWELFRASARVAEMLEVMDNVAAMENEVPASEAVSHWLGLDENLLSIKYEVGSLTSICARGELLVAFPGPSKAEAPPIAFPSPVQSESSPMASQPGDPSPIPCSGEPKPCRIARPSSDPDPGLQSLQAKPSPMPSQHGDPSPIPCSGEPKPCLIARPSSDPDPGLQSLQSKPKLMASQLGDLSVELGSDHKL